jgi:hypothetical protein
MMLLNHNFEYVKGEKGFKIRDTYLETIDLPQGRYYLYADMDWFDD